MSPETSAWLSAFLFTEAVEVPIYLACMQLPADDDRPRALDGPGGRLAVAFGASLVTHPIVWFLIPRIPAGSYAEMVARAEAFAIVAEAFYFYALGFFNGRRAFLWSLAANAASATLGLVSRSTFGWP